MRYHGHGIAFIVVTNRIKAKFQIKETANKNPGTDQKEINLFGFSLKSSQSEII